jgi:hypothetical protein
MLIVDGQIHLWEKGDAVPATSSGAVLSRASDRRHGSSRCGPGADPPGAVGRQCVTVFTEELPWLQAAISSWSWAKPCATGWAGAFLADSDRR